LWGFWYSPFSAARWVIQIFKGLFFKIKANL
jgi:hypothetical protein